MKTTKPVKWLDLTEAARVSKLSPWTLRRWCNHIENGIDAPLIPHRRRGRTANVRLTAGVEK